MAKRSRKRPAQSRKDDNAGCMWGLINMLDFRQGHSNQKFLSDRKRGSGRHVGTKYSRTKLDFLSNVEDTQEVDDVDEIREKVNLGVANVKTLMEEEMSRVYPSKKIPGDEIEQVRSELGPEAQLEKSSKQITKNCKVASDFLVNNLMTPTSFESRQSNCTDLIERSALNLDLAAFMMKFYGDNQEENVVDYKSKIGSCPVLETVDHRNHSHLGEPEYQLAENQSMLQKALADVTEIFLSQKFIDTTHFNGAVQSKEFMGALEMLSSNKEMLLDLLHNPNSLLVKHIHHLQNAQNGKLSQLESGKYLVSSELLEEICSSEQCEEPINHKLFEKQSGYNLFRKNDRSKGTNTSKGSDSSHALDRIVVLKPSPSRAQNSSPQSHHSLKCQEDGERVVSHFSFKEIKRRLRRVIGESRKEEHVISMDDILHRFPSGDSSEHIARGGIVKGLASKAYYRSEGTSQSSAIVEKRDKKSMPKERQLNIETENSSLEVYNHEKLDIAPTDHCLNSESFNEEAKKRLVEMLDTRDDSDILPTRQVSESLGRILNLPEYLLSPRFSIGRDKELDLSPTRQYQQDNATDCLCPLLQKLTHTSCTSNKQDGEAKLVDSNLTLIDTQIEGKICIGEDLNHEGTTEIVVIADIILMTECDHLDVHSESDGNKPGAVSDKEEGSTSSELVSFEEISPKTPSVSISSCSLLVQTIEESESILEKSERPSPVSILEPFLHEDVNSLGSTIDIQTELPILSQSSHFEEHDNPAEVLLTLPASEANPRICMNDKVERFDYIETVLEVSGLSWDEISDRCLPSDQLLDPSLFDEVGSSYTHLSDDPKLLFDCISEVLTEIQERLLSCTLWVPFVKLNVRPISIAGNLIVEVCEGIDRHLQWQSPRTLDQIVGKDMESGTWMDLRYEAEDIVIEIEYGILEDLIEETTLEMWVLNSYDSPLNFIDLFVVEDDLSTVAAK